MNIAQQIKAFHDDLSSLKSDAEERSCGIIIDYDYNTVMFDFADKSVLIIHDDCICDDHTVAYASR